MITSKTFIDLRTTISGGGTVGPPGPAGPPGPPGTIDQATLDIIEQNTNTQTNVKLLYTEIDWLNGLPSNIRKYEDNTKLNQVYDITITWANGLPSTISSNNMDDGINTITTFTWLNGVPTSITKTEV